jgi:bacterioferritin
MNEKKIVDTLNGILEHELAGVVRYTHYALMVFGYNRIPICSWLRGQAKESLAHADEVGEVITALNGHPSLKIGKLLESNKHKIPDILAESLEHEEDTIKHYYVLLEQVAGKSVWIEEFARKMISAEEMHISEVRKMLKDPK